MQPFVYRKISGPELGSHRRGLEKIAEFITIHDQVVRCLMNLDTSYAHPISSQHLGELLNVTPSYIRERMRALIDLKLVGVRRGRGGGYFLNMGERRIKAIMGFNQSSFEDIATSSEPRNSAFDTISD